MIEWFARNPVAANLLMICIVAVGLYSGIRNIPVEVFPSFDIQSVTVNTVLRGATPSTIEDTVTTRIESAIYDLEGIKEVVSRSSEGISTVVAKLQEDYDKRELLNKIKIRVDALNTLPREAEKPIVSLSTHNPGVIQVIVSGDMDATTLRTEANRVRNELLLLPDITLVELVGVADYEISVEIPQRQLDQFNISLPLVAEAIKQGSADISAGNLKSLDGDILIRTDGQAYSGEEFARIPIINRAGGDPVLLRDIATIRDGFEEQPLQTLFNAKPAILMDVSRTGSQSSLRISEQVRDYIDEENSRLNSRLRLEYWDDDSKILKARLATLISSGIYGGILVLLVLSLFLRPAIAFWVFLGVPVSFMGALIFMPYVGGTFNIISLFAFITVLGIVVDDAIVTGENIYRKMRTGMEPLQASIVGTKEIAIPVTFGILTTIVAFFPMTDLGSNRIGYLAAQIPMVVIPVLLFSLIESKFVLPAHLSHVKPRSTDKPRSSLSGLQLKVSRGFEQSILRYYRPFLKKCLMHKAITLATLVAVSAIIAAWAVSGHLKFTFFPRVAAEEIRFSLTMPDTTGFDTTHQNIQRITNEVLRAQEKYRDAESGQSVIRHTYSTVGSIGSTLKPSVGIVRAELIGPEQRHIDIRATELADEIRQNVGTIAGAESLSIRAELGRGGEPIDIELSGTDTTTMRQVGDRVRQRLREYPDVFDIKDNYSGGKEQLLVDLNAQAYALGLDRADVASQVRFSIFGFEAQRVQRGREEVRVMVRLPKDERSSIEDLQQLPIQANRMSTPIPLSDVATITPSRSPTTLYRLNRSAIINITADVNKDRADVPAILRDLRGYLEEEQQAIPSLDFTFKGEAEEQAENNQGLQSGMVLVLIAIYALLAIPFKSYTQPLIIMSVIPFSVVGAALGHIITGYNLSILSMVGMMALLGVVVNDSLVLVDYINKQRRNGHDSFSAVLESGSARFRPVILTSLTTFAGLTPLLLDKSTQSEFLKPMAISLGFGIVFATTITLLMVPVLYQSSVEMKVWLSRVLKQLWSSRSQQSYRQQKRGQQT